MQLQQSMNFREELLKFPFLSIGMVVKTVTNQNGKDQDGHIMYGQNGDRQKW